MPKKSKRTRQRIGITAMLLILVAGAMAIGVSAQPRANQFQQTYGAVNQGGAVTLSRNFQVNDQIHFAGIDGQAQTSTNYSMEISLDAPVLDHTEVGSEWSRYE